MKPSCMIGWPLVNAPIATYFSWNRSMCQGYAVAMVATKYAMIVRMNVFFMALVFCF